MPQRGTEVQKTLEECPKKTGRFKTASRSRLVAQVESADESLDRRSTLVSKCGQAVLATLGSFARVQRARECRHPFADWASTANVLDDVAPLLPTLQPKPATRGENSTQDSRAKPCQNIDAPTGSSTPKVQLLTL